MPDEKTGFQPAPWEAGKRPTQGPQGYRPPAQPQQQPAPPAYGAPQSGYLAAPLGGQASDAFGGGDTGRGRTRQIPSQRPPVDSQAAPAPYPQAAQVPYPQQAPYPQPAGYPPQAPYPQQQPYGAPQAAYPTQKQTSLLAILSLVAIGVGLLAGLFSIGLFSPPFLLAGAILGFLGMRDTAAWGKKTGRGMALAGTITNLVLLVVNVGVLLAGFLFIQKAGNELEKGLNASIDGEVIVRGLEAYGNAKGDLQPGGPQIVWGSRTGNAATGPTLTVADVVSAAELKNPVSEYSLTIKENTAIVTWTSPDGYTTEVGYYTHYAGYDIPAPRYRSNPYGG